MGLFMQPSKAEVTFLPPPPSAMASAVQDSCNAISPGIQTLYSVWAVSIGLTSSFKHQRRICILFLLKSANE